ncbi:hypothetical protein KW795_00940 [Candidatus Microgenomates bacterium]|nr:hypothetical protein [Candidatus Microgenomates bacterium]
MDNVISFISKSFSFKVGNFTISPNYLQAFLVLLLVFMLVFTMARMHHLFIRWSFKGAIVGVLIGFILALIVEGFFLVGGSTVLTATLGWKNAPKPIAKILDDNREKIQNLVCEPGK